MGKNMKSLVMELLNRYKHRAREIAVLRYELDLISKRQDAGPTFPVSIPEHCSGSSFNAACRLFELEQTQARLEYYVSLLDERQAIVIRMIYFERHTKDAVALHLSLSPRTIRDIKNTAIEELTKMYSYTYEDDESGIF